MGMMRRDFRGISWADYHYMCRGYLRRCARQEVYFRNLAAVWGGRKVYDGWKIPEIDHKKVDRLPELTDEDRRRARKIFEKMQRNKQ